MEILEGFGLELLVLRLMLGEEVRINISHRRRE